MKYNTGHLPIRHFPIREHKSNGKWQDWNKRFSPDYGKTNGKSKHVLFERDNEKRKKRAMKNYIHDLFNRPKIYGKLRVFEDEPHSSNTNPALLEHNIKFIEPCTVSFKKHRKVVPRDGRCYITAAPPKRGGLIKAREDLDMGLYHLDAGLAFTLGLYTMAALLYKKLENCVAQV